MAPSRNENHVPARPISAPRMDTPPTTAAKPSVAGRFPQWWARISVTERPRTTTPKRNWKPRMMKFESVPAMLVDVYVCIKVRCGAVCGGIWCVSVYVYRRYSALFSLSDSCDIRSRNQESKTLSPNSDTIGYLNTIDSHRDSVSTCQVNLSRPPKFRQATLQSQLPDCNLSLPLPNLLATHNTPDETLTASAHTTNKADMHTWAPACRQKCTLPRYKAPLLVTAV